MACSMIAGAFAAVITNPLDLAKLRMQISRAGVREEGFSDYKHMFDAVGRIFRKEGILSLWKGAGTRAITQMCTVGIAMSVVEGVKPKVTKLLDN